MDKIKILLSILACVFTFNLHAQQDPGAETKRLTALSQKLAGTYQVQIINSREKIAMPLSILDTVEAKRHPSETVYFWMKDRVRVMVLPLSQINAKDFKPLERVVYISAE